MLMLRNQLNSLAKGSDTLQQYLLKAKGLKIRFETAGGTIGFWEYASVVCNGLPEEYGMAVMSIMTNIAKENGCRDHDSLAMELSTVEMVLAGQGKRQSSQSQPFKGGNAFSAQGSSNSSGSSTTGRGGRNGRRGRGNNRGTSDRGSQGNFNSNKRDSR
ncbi:uncharacterized protein DFL_009350 [Arthrobotrys flagrans]|uniref:Uncharacterized protein n=1 Tax=Arthrobotrys flagrans TaxID=97331 RepID=A0A436ZRV1_ARTFL|nr:hypothetical protein DFL_009350 [Arthrobotrys flagrans]